MYPLEDLLQMIQTASSPARKLGSFGIDKMQNIPESISNAMNYVPDFIPTKMAYNKFAGQIPEPEVEETANPEVLNRLFDAMQTERSKPVYRFGMGNKDDNYKIDEYDDSSFEGSAVSPLPTRRKKLGFLSVPWAMRKREINTSDAEELNPLETIMDVAGTKKQEIGDFINRLLGNLSTLRM